MQDEIMSNIVIILIILGSVAAFMFICYIVPVIAEIKENEKWQKLSNEIKKKKELNEAIKIIMQYDIDNEEKQFGGLK